MDFQKEFQVAQKTIVEASEIALSYINNLKISFKLDGSTLTQADKKTEDFIINRLKSHFPSYGFINEESKSNYKDISWIIDPIDGTIAYSRGIPEFGIVIALKKDNEIIFSTIYFPLSKDLIHAYRNKGTYRNKDELKVSTVSNINHALFSLDQDHIWAEKYHEYAYKLVRDRRFRIGHSAAIESYYLSSGKIDVLVKMEEAVWDVAPEYLIMKEAGASIYDIHGKPFVFDFSKYTKYDYVATNPILAKKGEKVLFVEE